eukprot:sb/3479162/
MVPYNTNKFGNMCSIYAHCRFCHMAIATKDRFRDFSLVPFCRQWPSYGGGRDPYHEEVQNRTFYHLLLIFSIQITAKRRMAKTAMRIYLIIQLSN